MNNEATMEQLLRWRQAQAEAAAPPAPRAARLLARVQPWWETGPEHFSALVQRLSQIQLAYGRAMENQPPGQRGHPVPALISEPGEEREVFARILYFSVKDGCARLRFSLETGAAPAGPDYEVTFVSTMTRQPLLSCRATHSVEQEYRLEADLTDELAAEWSRLKVTDDMPYRLILRPSAGGRENA